jgi:hypothetical protein
MLGLLRALRKAVSVVLQAERGGIRGHGSTEGFGGQILALKAN